MPEILTLMKISGTMAIVAPYTLVALVGVPTLFDKPLGERTTARVSMWLISLGLFAAALTLGLMLVAGSRHVVISFGQWFALHDHIAGEHYHFTLKFEFDRLSVPLTLLSFALCGTISAFAARYLHREPGYNRFFTLFALFLAGMVTASLADTIETLFAGWELVGLSSALLVAFFHERPAPPRNGLRVWLVYRLSDAALLLAAVWLHHMTGEGDFDLLMGHEPWPHGTTALTADQALLIGLLLLLAAAGKSALIPFSGWLPRAMEGPTPSSAVFYGALSVHLGIFLLMRCSPLIAASPWLAAIIVLLGLATAASAYLVARVQTDIKSVLAFASLTQVGIIVAEVGLGHWVPFLWYVALTHLLGNALLRTLQFLRAPSLLRDYRELENALGNRLPPTRTPTQRLPRWCYRYAFERGYGDVLLLNYLIAPMLQLFRICHTLEQRWADWLNGQQPQPPLAPHQEPTTSVTTEAH